MSLTTSKDDSPFLIVPIVVGTKVPPFKSPVPCANDLPPSALTSIYSDESFITDTKSAPSDLYSSTFAPL